MVSDLVTAPPIIAFNVDSVNRKVDIKNNKEKNKLKVYGIEIKDQVIKKPSP